MSVCPAHKNEPGEKEGVQRHTSVEERTRTDVINNAAVELSEPCACVEEAAVKDEPALKAPPKTSQKNADPSEVWAFPHAFQVI